MYWNNFQHKRKRNETNAIYNAQFLVLRFYDFDVWTRKNAKKRVDWMIRIFLKSVKIKMNYISSHCKNINIWSRAKFWLTLHLLTPPPKSADMDIPDNVNYTSNSFRDFIFNFALHWQKKGSYTKWNRKLRKRNWIVTEEQDRSRFRIFVSLSVGVCVLISGCL